MGFHPLVPIAFVVFALTMIVLGLRARDRDGGEVNGEHERRFGRALGFTGLVIWIAAQLYGFMPGVFTWEHSLPLHVCDMAALTGCIVMLQREPAPWLRSVLYFAGIGLCTQAFITPTLREGPGDPQFWCFWSGHFTILGFALYDLAVRRWRPTWRDWRIAVVISLAYALAIFALNIAFGWNYGFVGEASEPGTLIEIIGPWPGRVLILVGLAFIAYVGLMLPWALLAREGGRRG
jgi:hypothetical integral membrane protein (TIGR02206 family)